MMDEGLMSELGGGGEVVVQVALLPEGPRGSQLMVMVALWIGLVGFFLFSFGFRVSFFSFAR